MNDEGLKQIEKLADNINLDDIDICIFSPLKRTKETVKILVGNKIEIIYNGLLIERGYGNYEGKKINFASILKQWDYQLNDFSNNV